MRLKDGAILPVSPDKSFVPGSAVVVSIRPEQLRIEPLPTERAVSAVIKTVLPLGAHVVYDVALAHGPSLKISEPRDAQRELRRVGATVYLKPASLAACHVFPSP